MRRSNYSHKFNEDAIGICLECRKKLHLAGYRIEKKPQLGWWPTNFQEKYIREHWESKPTAQIARDIEVSIAKLDRYARKINLPNKAYNYKQFWGHWLALHNQGYFPSEICENHFKETGKNVSRETVQSALKAQGVKLTGSRVIK